MVQELKMLELKAKHKNELEKAIDSAGERAVTLLIPIISTSLHEVYGFGEERQKPCIQKVMEVFRECVSNNVFDWDEYREFCKQKGKKCFVEVE